MATTSNFGWTTPDDTDLVKDGAAAIRTLGSAIDTSLVDLKGGTTGQVLSKTSNTDMDFTWVAQDDTDAIQSSIIAAKGDLIVGTANDTAGILSVGTDGYTLVADSSTATGLAYAAPVSSGLTLISRQSFSNVANTGTTFDNVFTSTYKTYKVIIEKLFAGTSGDNPQIQILYSGSTQAASYTGVTLEISTGSTIAYTVSSNTTEYSISADSGDTTYPTFADMTFYSIGSGSARPAWSLTGFSNATVRPIVGGGYIDVAQSYTGILFKSASSNITGTVAIYGLAV